MSKSIVMPVGTANIKELFKGCFIKEEGVDGISHRSLTEDEKSDLVTAVEMCFSEKQEAAPKDDSKK